MKKIFNKFSKMKEFVDELKFAEIFLETGSKSIKIGDKLSEKFIIDMNKLNLNDFEDQTYSIEYLGPLIKNLTFSEAISELLKNGNLRIKRESWADQYILRIFEDNYLEKKYLIDEKHRSYEFNFNDYLAVDWCVYESQDRI